MPRKDAHTGQISAKAQQELVSEGIENFELPKSIVAKIAKSALPENAKLQKETVLSLVKGSTVFINYLGAWAHDVAQSKQHKSISASDVLKALELLEFGDLVEPLQSELLVYRELAKTDKSKKGSANLNNGQAAVGSSASAPPNASKKPGAVPSVPASGVQQQNVSAPLKIPLKARVKVPKATSGATSAMQLPANDDDVPMGESASAPMVGAAGLGPDEDVEEHADNQDGEDAMEESNEQHEGEEMVDPMQVEEEELRRDALGVEQRSEE
ncbi:histone-fold-containing protein [Amanita rubescens]|nr:histone-fold-containing protein [Amanita rubescens]